MKRYLCWVAPLALLLGVGQADALVVYSNDFEGAVGAEWSSTQTSVTPVGLRQFLGRFGNETVSLSLDSLPAHSAIEIETDLFIIQSWDGNQGDIWDLSVFGGENLLRTTFSAVDCSPTLQAYPDNFPGGNNPAGTGATEVNTLGYPPVGCPGETFMDTVYHLEFSFSHA